MDNQQPSVIFGNLKHENVGTVSIAFDDGTIESREITSLGHTVFDTNRRRKPTTITLLEKTIDIGTLPQEISFPNGETGTMYSFTFEGGPVIIMSDIY